MKGQCQVSLMAGVFLKDSAIKSTIFCWNEGAVSCVLCKNIISADLSGSQYLFEILQNSFTVKKSENVIKCGCFEKLLRWRAPNFFRNEGGI